MNDFIRICSRPFISLLKDLSDHPLSCAVFVSFIAGLIRQDIGFGFLFFMASLAVLALIYIVTFGKAFGRSGRPKMRIKS